MCNKVWAIMPEILFVVTLKFMPASPIFFASGCFFTAALMFFIAANKCPRDRGYLWIEGGW